MLGIVFVLFLGFMVYAVNQRSLVQISIDMSNKSLAITLDSRNQNNHD